MDIEFFEKKISKLDDDRLRHLLTLTNPANKKVIEVAMAEATQRGMDILAPTFNDDIEPKTGDKRKLRKWNWAAFAVAPLWTLAHQLDRWAMLTMIPGVNLFAMFYLGVEGNRLAFPKSKIIKVDDFMMVQDHWRTFGIIVFALILIFTSLGLLFQI